MKVTHENLILHVPNGQSDEIARALTALTEALKGAGVTHVTRFAVTAKIGERILDIDWARVENDDKD